MKLTIVRSNPYFIGEKRHTYRCGERTAKVSEPYWRIVPLGEMDAKDKNKYDKDVKKEIIFVAEIDVDVNSLNTGETFALEGFPIKDTPKAISRVKLIEVKRTGEPKKEEVIAKTDTAQKKKVKKES